MSEFGTKTRKASIQVQIDVWIREVEGKGHLPIVELDHREIYRGEFQADPGTALENAVAFVRKFREGKV